MEVTHKTSNQALQPAFLKKMDVKIKQGPCIQRATLGNIGNKPFLREKNVLKENLIKKNIAPTKPILKGKNKDKHVPVKETKKEKNHGKSDEEMEVTELAVDELSDAFSSQLMPVNVEDIDTEDANNQQLVSEYVNDIYKYMWDIEDENKVKQNYLDGRKITFKMRAILIDWLVQVHMRFSLLQETLYLTVAIIDRYLQSSPSTPKEELQLVGVTAMFIASKYEEMYIPEIGDFSYITDKAFSKGDIRKMEVKMLKSLKFYISYPLPLHFLRRNSKAAHANGMQHSLAKYLMELTLGDYYFCHFKPSQIAAAALYLSLRLIGKDIRWNETLTYYSKYSEKDIMPIVSKLSCLVIRSAVSKQQAVRSKYKAPKFFKISELPELKQTCASLKKLAELA